MRVRDLQIVGGGVILALSISVLPFIWGSGMLSVVALLMVSLALWLIIGPEKIASQNAEARAALENALAEDSHLAERRNLAGRCMIVGRALIAAAAILGLTTWTRFWVVGAMAIAGFLVSAFGTVVMADIERRARHHRSPPNEPR